MDEYVLQTPVQIKKATSNNDKITQYGVTMCTISAQK